jgi:hypothetical protein
MEWTIQDLSTDEFDLDIEFVEEAEEADQDRPEFVSCSAYSCANQRTCNTLRYCEGCA